MIKQWMREAIALAAEGAGRGDGGPFGALVVLGGEVIGRGWNRVLAEQDPTAHAEVIAIRQAARRLGSPHLQGAVLYSSCEPCPMCLCAAYWARLERICYGATAADAAAIGFDDGWLYRELARPRGERRMPMEQALRDEVLAVFRQWEASDRKLLY
ncbi:MAG TPA: nucleoside deaminase [Sedimenticola thiotaurini]|uniref:Nucleoside deaminase n=1 Tax=Sedimenticola thiotaurini TaxID=1543721 RepID=A0A831WBP0_9GAMM|nr:nucleoside deaminase [Sedimenticola thiotaurini]